MRKNVGFYIVMLVLIAAACKKDRGPEQVDPTLTDPVTASENFNWRTTKKVNVSVKGTPVSTEVNRKFSIELENGTLVYEATQNMKNDYQFSIELPVHVTKLVYKYGSITKEAEVSGSNLELNYLITTDNGYIQ